MGPGAEGLLLFTGDGLDRSDDRRRGRGRGFAARSVRDAGRGARRGLRRVGNYAAAGAWSARRWNCRWCSRRIRGWSEPHRCGAADARSEPHGDERGAGAGRERRIGSSGGRRARQVARGARDRKRRHEDQRMTNAKPRRESLYEKHESSLLEGPAGLSRAQLLHVVPGDARSSSRRSRDGRSRRPRLPCPARAASVLDQPGTVGRVGGEISPYTLEALGHRLPAGRSRRAVRRRTRRNAAWAAARREARLGVCMEIVDRLDEGIFETAQAVQHTAAQSGPMSYAGSGTNALDRGVEALAYAEAAMTRRAARSALGAPLRFRPRSGCASVIGSCRAASRLLYLRDVPDLERISGDVREPRDRQCGDREAAPDGRAADGGLPCAFAVRCSPRRAIRRTSSRCASIRSKRRWARSRLAPADGDRGFHGKCALRRLGRGQCASGPLLSRKRRA